MNEQLVPNWLRDLAAAALSDTQPVRFSRRIPPGPTRSSAVLLLFSEESTGPNILLIERAATLRDHAGQPAFPGGATDPGDGSPVTTALREAAEEVGLDPTSAHIVAELHPLHIPISGFAVTPVIGWQARPTKVRVIDSAEVSRVERVPLSELADPANRCRVRQPSGRMGPAFTVRGMFVWGFTGGLLDWLLDLGGWSVPWPQDAIREMPLPPTATEDSSPNKEAR